MTYPQVLNTILPEEAQLLQEYVDQGILQEAQVPRILEKSMKVTDRSGPHLTRVGVNKLLEVLEIIRGLRLKEEHPKSYREVFKRLVAREGPDTVNELLCHVILHHLCKAYYVSPLYEPGPDGHIRVDNQVLAVEIKSRLPQKHELLHDFVEKVYELMRLVPEHLDITCQMLFTNIKGLSAETVTENLIDLKRLFLESDFEGLSRSPYQAKLTYSTDRLSFTLEIVTERSKPGNNALRMPDHRLREFYTIAGAVDGEAGLTGLRVIEADLSDEVKQQLATAIITQCFSNSKNTPPEPRVIVIHSTHGDESISFIKRIVDEYIRTRSRTIVLVVNSYFVENSAMGYRILYAKHGSELNEFVSQNFTFPAKIKTREGFSLQRGEKLR